MRILILFLVFSVYLVSCTKDIHEKEYTDINSESNDLNSKSNSTIETNYYSIQSVNVPFKNVDVDSKYSSFFLEIKKELDTRDLHGVSNYLENIGNLDWEKSIIFIKDSENISMVTPLIDTVNQKISGILYSYKQASKINFEFVEYTILLEEITNRPDEIRSKKLYNDILFVNFFSYYKYGQTIFGYSDILVGLANNITDHLRYEPILTLEPCDDPFADNTGCVWVKGLGGYYRIVKRWKFNWSAGFNKSFGLNGNLTTDWLDSDGGGSSTDTNNNESLRDKLFKNPLNKILKTMVNRASLEFINNLGLNMTLDDLYEIVPADCYTIPNDPLDSEVNMDEDCAKDAITNEIFTKFGITDQETKDWVEDNPDVWNMLLKPEEQNAPQGDGTIVTATNLCPQAFPVVTLGNNPPNPPVDVSLLQGLNIQFNVNGIMTTFSFSKIAFWMESSCQNTSVAFSNAVASALQNAQTIISNAAPSTQSNSAFVRAVFFGELDNSLAAEWSACTGNILNDYAEGAAGIYGVGTMSNIFTSGELQQIPGTTILTSPISGQTSLQDLGCP